MHVAETYTPAEISAVTGASVRAVYKAVGERLPSGLLVHRDRQLYLTRVGALCFAIDREIPKDVPVAVRRKLYTTILERQSAASVQYASGIMSYVVDVKSVADRLDESIARYRQAINLIVQDQSIQGGAATIRGTRILAHHVADLLGQGVDVSELGEDYPRLTPVMIEAARVYAQAHPKRGRPKGPAWRKGAAAGRPGNPPRE